MTPIFAAAALLIFQASAANTAPPSAPPTEAVTPATTEKTSAPKLNKDGKVCRKQAVLGSRLPIRVCETPEESAARKAEAHDMLDAAQRDLSNTGH